MKWNIVTDSSCDRFPAVMQSGLAQLSSVPFVIRVGDRDFVDDDALDTAEMLDAMERCEQASHTFCPAPHDWLERFEQAEQSIAITISSRLSGSMISAELAREMALERWPEKRIAVLDSRSTGPELVLCVKKICALIGAGADFDTVVAEADAFLRDTHVAFALSSFENLVKNGAIPACETVGVIFNRIQGDNRTLEELQKLVGLPVLGIVPYDQTLQNFDAQGKTLLELSDETPAVAAVKKFVDKLMA